MITMVFAAALVTRLLSVPPWPSSVFALAIIW